MRDRKQVEKSKSCGHEFPWFGASYPDARCIDGRLWDLDSGENGMLDKGGDDPCPWCNTEEYVQDMRDNEISEDNIKGHLMFLGDRYGYGDSILYHTPSRKQRLIEFVRNVLREYSSLEYEIEEWEKSKEFDEFTIVIKVDSNSHLHPNQVVCCFQVSDDCIEVLKGDCFYETDELDFTMHLFLTVFIEEPKPL